MPGYYFCSAIPTLKTVAVSCHSHCFDDPFSSWKTGGAGAGTIAPTALRSFSVCPPATLSNVNVPATQLPIYTSTSTIPTLTFVTPTPTASRSGSAATELITASVGNGWFDRQEQTMTPVAGCPCPDAWNPRFRRRARGRLELLWRYSRLRGLCYKASPTEAAGTTVAISNPDPKARRTMDAPISATAPTPPTTVLFGAVVSHARPRAVALVPADRLTVAPIPPSITLCAVAGTAVPPVAAPAPA
ncbi:hypothetical protein DFH09DRAFT_1341824 [Mycena vulgaris]|nr:hypothetical protein DFH09DRAFT_1341824 [Mycena vulgaris]